MLRAAAIALPRALLAGACYGGSLLARIAGKASSAYALQREWRAVVRALDDRMLRDIGLGRSGDRIRNLRQRSRERIALARISRHECQHARIWAGGRAMKRTSLVRCRLLSE